MKASDARNIKSGLGEFPKRETVFSLSAGVPDQPSGKEGGNLLESLFRRHAVGGDGVGHNMKPPYFLYTPPKAGLSDRFFLDY
jgi:hypothetical protein